MKYVKGIMQQSLRKLTGKEEIITEYKSGLGSEETKSSFQDQDLRRLGGVTAEGQEIYIQNRAHHAVTERDNKEGGGMEK